MNTDNELFQPPEGALEPETWELDSDLLKHLEDEANHYGLGYRDRFWMWFTESLQKVKFLELKYNSRVANTRFDATLIETVTIKSRRFQVVAKWTWDVIIFDIIVKTRNEARLFFVNDENHPYWHKLLKWVFNNLYDGIRNNFDKRSLNEPTVYT